MKTCAVCGRDMTGTNARAKYCTKRCRSKGQRKPWHGPIGNYRYQRRKAGLPILEIEPVTLDDLVDRDGTDCGICGAPLQPPMHIDHIIPISDPRCTHTMGNLRAVHAHCNVRRGNSRDFFTI